MFVDAFLSLLPALLQGNLDPAPEPENVKAGWTAFGIFLGGVATVALLGWSLVKQLRKVEDARKKGVYGDEPELDGETEIPAAGTTTADEGTTQA
jgi:hypothetical protein